MPCATVVAVALDLDIASHYFECGVKSQDGCTPLRDPTHTFINVYPSSPFCCCDYLTQANLFFFTNFTFSRLALSLTLISNYDDRNRLLAAA